MILKMWPFGHIFLLCIRYLYIKYYNNMKITLNDIKEAVISTLGMINEAYGSEEKEVYFNIDTKECVADGEGIKRGRGRWVVCTVEPTSSEDVDDSIGMDYAWGQPQMDYRSHTEINDCEITYAYFEETGEEVILSQQDKEIVCDYAIQNGIF